MLVAANVSTGQQLVDEGLMKQAGDLYPFRFNGSFEQIVHRRTLTECVQVLGCRFLPQSLSEAQPSLVVEACAPTVGQCGQQRPLLALLGR